MKKLTTLAKKKLVIAALEDIKAHDIVAIEVHKLTSLCDWIVVASADSARQTKALARNLRDRLREAGAHIIGVEGEESGDWVLVDAGDIVAHVMQPAVRQYYSLEELWSDGRFDKTVNSTLPQGTRRAARGARKEATRREAPRKRKAASKTRRKSA